MDAAPRRSRQKGKAMSRESTHAERIKRAAKRRARKLKAKEIDSRLSMVAEVETNPCEHSRVHTI
jgi:hypothetical protein